MQRFFIVPVKRLRILLEMLCLCLVLTACSKSEVATGDPDSEDPPVIPQNLYYPPLQAGGQWETTSVESLGWDVELANFPGFLSRS